MRSNNSRIDNLSFLTCRLLDLKGGQLDCSETRDVCIQCGLPTVYLDPDETINDIGSRGHIMCDVQWMSGLFVSVLGLLGNAAIIEILSHRKPHSQQGFDFLLMVLAIADVVCILGSASTASFHIAFGDNWMRRDRLDLRWLLISYVIQMLGRSASVFLTLLAALERYLWVAFPIRTGNWLETKLLALLVLVIVLALNVPRILTYSVVDNLYYKEHRIQSVRSLRHLIISTLPWNWRLRIGIIDFLLPLPVLLFFNCLTFYEVWKFSRRRSQKLSKREQKAVNSAKVFLPVIVVLLLSNISPIVNYMIVRQKRISFRELEMLSRLSLIVTSSINFPIYYIGGSAFRLEVKNLFASIGDKVSGNSRSEVRVPDNERSRSGSGFSRMSAISFLSSVRGLMSRTSSLEV